MSILIDRVEIPGGSFFTNVPADFSSLTGIGVTPDRARQLIDDATSLTLKVEARHRLRQEIKLSAGDVQSLLGTTADTVQFLLYELSKLSKSLSEANNLADVRASAVPINEILSGFSDRVDDNEVRLPYQLKGIDNLMPEVEARATAVNDVLISINAQI